MVRLRGGVSRRTQAGITLDELVSYARVLAWRNPCDDEIASDNEEHPVISTLHIISPLAPAAPLVLFGTRLLTLRDLFTALAHTRYARLYGFFSSFCVR